MPILPQPNGSNENVKLWQFETELGDWIRTCSMWQECVERFVSNDAEMVCEHKNGHSPGIPEEENLQDFCQLRVSIAGPGQ